MKEPSTISVPPEALESLPILVLRDAVLTVYDIEADDRAFRQMPEPVAERRTYFDRLRKTYPERREFHNTELILRGASATLKGKLAGLGFQTTD